MKRKSGGHSGSDILHSIRKDHFLTVRNSSTSPAASPTPKAEHRKQLVYSSEATEEDTDNPLAVELAAVDSIVESPGSSTVKEMDNNVELYGGITPAEVTNQPAIRERAWTNDSEMSMDPIAEFNRLHQRKWSVGSLSDREEKDRETEIDYIQSKFQVPADERRNSVSIGNHEKNLIMAPHRQDILSNIEEVNYLHFKSVGSFSDDDSRALLCFDISGRKIFHFTECSTLCDLDDSVLILCVSFGHCTETS